MIDLKAIEERANEWAKVGELPVFECGECVAADLANQVPYLLAEVAEYRRQIKAGELVRVVRCKDCKWNKSSCQPHCLDYFCSDGRTEEKE